MLEAAGRYGLLPRETWAAMTVEEAKALYPKYQGSAIAGNSLAAVGFHYIVMTAFGMDEQSLEVAERLLGRFTYKYACGLAGDHLENLFRAISGHSEGGG